MKVNFLKYSLLAGFLCVTFASLAQDTTRTTAPEPLTEEIEVVRPYKPVLADAVKIRRNPNMETDQFKAVLSYNIIDKKLDLNSNIKQLQAQNMADEQPEVLINNYAKGAAGNFGTALGEVYVNTGRDRALQAGAFFKHLSQQGDIERQQFSNQQLGIFGRSVQDDSSVSGRLTYNRNSSYFYGLDPLAAPLPEIAKQRFSTIRGQVELINNYSEHSTLDYALNLDAYHFGNIDDARENSMLIGGSINKAVNLLNIGVNASADFTAVKDEAYKMGNSLLRANPYVKLQVNNFGLTLGANIVKEFGDNARLNIFPAVSAEVPVIPEYAIVFAGVNGDVLKSSLRDIALENPYLSNNIAIKNSVEKMNIYAGVKGNVGAGFGYKASAFYKTVSDLMLYANNRLETNRFEVIYDDGDSKLAGLQGEINVKASEVLSISGEAQIINYELASEKEAWFKPSLRLSSNARLQLGDRLALNGELVFQGETFAKTFGTATAVEETTKIKSFMDISAGAEYRINKQFGVFLHANNLLDADYQKYLYYRKLGLNLFGGVSYSF